MARRQKVTVTITSDRLEQLDEMAVARDTNRSALIEEALEAWERNLLNQELAAGYKAMADEDRQTAEERLRSGSETLD
jgi:predicted transcriptional regulator